MKPIPLVITTKDNPDYLTYMLRTLRDRTLYPYLSVVANNGGPLPSRIKPDMEIKPEGGTRSSHGLNTAMKHLKDYPLVGWMNDDVRVVQEDWLAKLAEVFDDPKVGSSGPMGCHGGFGHQQIENPNLRDIIYETSHLQGFCVIIRRAAWDDIGGRIHEGEGVVDIDDHDLSARMRKKGWKQLFRRDVFLYHFGGVSLGKEEGYGSEERFRKMKEMLRAEHGDDGVAPMWVKEYVRD